VDIVADSKTPLAASEFISLEYWTRILVHLGVQKDIGMEDGLLSVFLPLSPAASPQKKDPATRASDAQVDTVALAIRIWIAALARSGKLDSKIRLSCFKVLVKVSMDGQLYERHFTGCASALASLFQDIPPHEWTRVVCVALNLSKNKILLHEIFNRNKSTWAGSRHSLLPLHWIISSGSTVSSAPSPLAVRN
jgi:hypothetical protein